jgi:signal transduction histidine kinase
LTEKLASVSRLAATVAHELNNPLEAVTNFIYLAQTTEELPPTAKEYLTLADRELERVSHIAQQTLGFYRDTSALTSVDIRASVDDVLRVFEGKLRYKSLQTDLDIEPGLHFEAHPGEVRQVFSNLISNAIDASPKHGVIKVHGKTVVKHGERCVQIAFADCGCGIPDRLKASIFNPFFTTKSDVGTGLGLWVSKSLVEKHGGRIAFRTADGKGTVFCVQFPLSVASSRKERRRAIA